MHRLKFLIKKLFSFFKRLIPVKYRIFLIRQFQADLSKDDKILLGYNNMFLSLSNLLIYNYKPLYIIDVGAYAGEWTKEVYKIFPEASFIAVEALPDKAKALVNDLKNLPVKVYNNLLGAKSMEKVRFFSMETGSSVFAELTNIPRKEILLDMITLDELYRRENFSGNVLLKLDVQGYELEILKGATDILKLVDVICAEVSFLNYNQDAPLAHEVISSMQTLGFSIYDIPSFTRKRNDYALVQADIIFLRSDSELRKKINNLKDRFQLIFS